MSGKTLKFNVDGDNCISLTLSESGRISLSDITAATIGSLEDVCWNEQQPDQDLKSNTDIDGSTEVSSTTPAYSIGSQITTSATPTNTSANQVANAEFTNQPAHTWSALKPDPDFNFHNGASVLRPWESESIAKRSETNSYQMSLADPHNVNPSQGHSNPPPTYHEHIKRQYDTSDGNKENQANKRYRMDQNPRPNNLSDQISSFYKNLSNKPVTDSGLFCAQSAQNSPLSGAGLPGVSEATNHISSFYKNAPNSQQSIIGLSALPGVSEGSNQISSFYKSAQNSPLSTARLPAVSEVTNQISSFYKNAQNSPLSGGGVSEVTNQISSFYKSAKNSPLSGGGVSEVTNQISSFYKNAQNSPQSARRLPLVSEAFSYPALSNFVKQEPTSPIVKVHQQPQQQTATSTSLYQPWSASPNMNPLATPASSQGSVKFLGSSLGFLETLPPQPHTPRAKLKPTFTTSLESPGVDSRMNDSLSLLGSPQVDTSLSKHPYFGDLQALLSNECKKETVPQSLFHMQQEKESPQQTVLESVFSREQKLQERFSKLQPHNPDEVRQMSSFFRYQTALIETERFKTLHECKYPGSYKDSINSHFDDKLHQVMDRVEKSVELLEKANSESKPSRMVKPRPHLRREAVLLMEAWYTENLEHPYPTIDIVEQLARAGNAGVEQVKKWFANKRNRSQNTRTLTEIAMKKRRLGQLSNSN